MESIFLVIIKLTYILLLYLDATVRVPVTVEDFCYLDFIFVFAVEKLMKVFVQYEIIKIYYLTCSNVTKRGCVGAVFQDMLGRL